MTMTVCVWHKWVNGKLKMKAEYEDADTAARLGWTCGVPPLDMPGRWKAVTQSTDGPTGGFAENVRACQTWLLDGHRLGAPMGGLWAEVVRVK